MICQVTNQSCTEVHSSRTQESNAAQQTKCLPYKQQSVWWDYLVLELSCLEGLCTFQYTLTLAPPAHRRHSRSVIQNCCASFSSFSKELFRTYHLWSKKQTLQHSAGNTGMCKRPCKCWKLLFCNAPQEPHLLLRGVRGKNSRAFIQAQQWMA